jgi:hypothetical protein
LSWGENVHNDTLGVIKSRRPLGAGNTTNAVTLPASYLFSAWHGVLNGLPTTVWNEAGAIKVSTDFLNTAPTAVTGVFSAASAYSNFVFFQDYLCYFSSSVATLCVYKTGTSITTSIPLSWGVSAESLDIGFVGRRWGASYSDINNRVYYSNPIPSTGITGGSIIGDPGNYLQLSLNESDAITGLLRSQNCLFVFTQKEWSTISEKLNQLYQNCSY